MNIVMYGRGLGRSRQLALSGRSATGLAVGVIAILGTLGFVGGYWYSSSSDSSVSKSQMASMTRKLKQEHEDIDGIRQDNEDTLDALAIRIAQMNARVIRLDALGRRLTDMANLDDGEFDFDAEPAVGGPEELLPDSSSGESGSNLAISDVEGSMATLHGQLDSREAQLDVLERMISNQNLKKRVYPQGRPVRAGWISSYYGKRTDPFTGKLATHTGVDFAGKMGAEVIAVADGVVTWSGPRYGYGDMVEINHGNGYSTRYAHNSALLVNVGDEVKKGEIISKMGDTGRATGPNLHFEVLKNGSRVNPLDFIKRVAQ